MGSAIWLFWATPKWYFSSVFHPFSAGILTLVLTIGSASLLIGVAMGLWRRQANLVLFLIPFAISQALVVFAGFCRGQFTTGGGYILYPFSFIEIVLVAWLIYRGNFVRISSWLLGVFTISYALFAWFVAAMSLADSWL